MDLGIQTMSTPSTKKGCYLFNKMAMLLEDTLFGTSPELASSVMETYHQVVQNHLQASSCAGVPDATFPISKAPESQGSVVAKDQFQLKSFL